MRVYLAGVPAGEESLENREHDALMMMDNRLISYHYVLSKGHPMETIKETINERNRDIHKHRRRS